jgi:phage regulator Rha-like protein
MQSNEKNPERQNLLPIISLNGVQVADSRLIAEGLCVKHKNLLETLKTHQETLVREFGQVAFETEAVKNSVGAINDVRFAYLTEDQFMFLGSLSRNTPEVVAFKAKLVKSFAEARKTIEEVRELATSLPRHLTTRVQQAMEADRQEGELREEVQALLEKQEFLEDRLFSLELSVQEDQYTTLKGYYKAQKRDFVLTSSEVQKLHFQLKKQSKSLGLAFFFVKDADYQIAYAYHVSILKTVLNF